jgi:hypothetical protein
MTEIFIQASHHQRAGKSVVFYWVPRHTGLSGNKTPDTAGKAADLYGSITSDKALGSDVRTFLHGAVLLP